MNSGSHHSLNSAGVGTGEVLITAPMGHTVYWKRWKYEQIIMAHCEVY